MNNKKHLTTLAATAVLLAISGAAEAGARTTANTDASAPLEKSINVIDSAAEMSKPAIGVSLVPELPLSPVSHQNAVRMAETYLEYTAFSRQGLIKQLEYEGFSTAVATSAVDQLAVDWNQQAAEMAETYLGYTAFSRSGLIEQLMYEGFTSAQAQYGVAAVGY